MVADGGTPDLGNAKLHDGEDACVKRRLNDGGNVLKVDDFVMFDVVLGLVMMADVAWKSFVDAGTLG